MVEAGSSRRPAYIAYHWLWRSLDWLFPPVCGGCGKLGVRWCSVCQGQVVKIKGAICERCGEPLGLSTRCRNCDELKPRYLALRSYGVFGGVLREAIHRLKYKNDLGLGEAICYSVYDDIKPLSWNFDTIIPVPLSKARMKERGYNQASLIAFPLALIMKKKYTSKAISRIRNTSSQVGLSAQDRRKNVSGAFMAYPKEVNGRSILLIDDVTTTGATIAACSEALIAAGAKTVYGFTLARAMLYDTI